MINRRRFLKGASALGVAGATGLPHTAHAQLDPATVDGKPTRLLLVMMNGGYAPIQTSAESFVNNTTEEMSFGFSTIDTRFPAKPFGKFGEITYDETSWGRLLAMPKVRERYACMGTVGASNHNSAHHFWKSAEGGLAQGLAARMGGTAPIKAARVGAVTGANDGTNVEGVALEPVASLESALATLNGAGGVLPKEHRVIMGRIMERTRERNYEEGFTNRENLSSLVDGYTGLADSYQKPPAEVNADEINAAYASATGIGQKLKVAEGLFRSGVNVVCVGEGGGTYWDTHDDNDASTTRGYFSIMEDGLMTFCDRMLGRDDMNLSIVFVSEHSRIPLINNHGPHLSTIIISDNAVGGASTGITDNGGLIPDAEASFPIQAWKAGIGELIGLHGSRNLWGEAPQHRKLIKSLGA